MNKEELSKLTSIKAEIKQIEENLNKLEPEYCTDAVSGSSPHFPYVKHSIKLEGYDYKNYTAKSKRIQSTLKKKLIELVEEKDKLTTYIYSLEDGDLRQILSYRYIDGLIWDEIGNKMRYAPITVRVKHDNFLKSISVNITSKVI